MEDTFEIPLEEAKRIGNDARQWISDGSSAPLQGKCYEVCHAVGNMMIDRGLPAQRDIYDVIHVRVGPNNDEKHFVFVISGEYISDTDSEYITIDASFDQFVHRIKTPA